MPRQRALRASLRARVETRVYGEPRGGQIRLGIVPLQVPADQVEIGWHVAAARRAQSERRRGGAFCIRGIDQVRVRNHLQHEVATRAGALGMLARIVIGRSLDQPNQQREFRRHRVHREAGQNRYSLASPKPCIARSPSWPRYTSFRYATRISSLEKCASSRSAITASVALRRVVLSSVRK